MTKSKKKNPIRYGDTDPPDRETNPFLPEPDDEIMPTSYHRFRVSDGSVLSYVRLLSDHVGFLRLLIEPEPKDLPEKFRGAWTGYADLHKAISQWLEGKGLTLQIMSPHEDFIDKASKYIDDHRSGRDYAKGPRFNTR